MPAKRKPPRLWLKPEGRDAAGKIIRSATWYIKDGDHRESTGCCESDADRAANALAEYINRKHIEEASRGCRRADQVPVGDIIALYLRDVVEKHARPKETKSRLGS